jgi:hypothetical protein
LPPKEVRKIQAHPSFKEKKGKPSPSKSREIRPEQVIPLEEGDFKDF